MVFESPAWARALPPVPLPDSITVEEFMYSEKHGRKSLKLSRNPYTCGLTGQTYTVAEVRERVDSMARAIAKRLDWSVANGTEWDKVACVFSWNTIDYVPLTHALHRLNAIASPANAAYSVSELTHQLRSTSAKVLFTCVPLLPVALEAAAAAKISQDHIFILDMPGQINNSRFVALSTLIEEGRQLPRLPPLKWVKEQGKRQVAYICFSSGTSGLPKGVMLSHHNIISNVALQVAYETYGRKLAGVATQVGLGLLPFSHIYGLVIICHSMPWHGDEVVVLPRYNLDHMLATIQKYEIRHLPLVPPIAIQLLQNKSKCDSYDLSSIEWVSSGAAPLGAKTIESMQRTWPKWKVGQGYGLTESSPAVCVTSEHDILNGTSGSIVLGARCKVIDEDGREVTELEKPGELFVQSPNICLGYMNNVKATAETFVWDEDGRWLRTGDVVVVRRSPLGTEHMVIVDRIKELIKVKGNQVAPAELEAHLLSHPFVADCAVIPIPDDFAGEVPKAFVVKDVSTGDKSDEEVKTAICRYVESHKAKYKWLQGGVEFIETIPKSPSGKILRRVLRTREKEKSAGVTSKL
ncbi:phenylacetyl ligase [Fusarium circinatum]|uniref:Phenylacetyl ligase n=1 Tax=Fusarium circinatum TaxID=48490 RepID=A0A8H5T8J4_FUSCI|nr:phenylacetyl ligase [Fusarium circinatum]